MFLSRELNVISVKKSLSRGRCGGIELPSKELNAAVDAVGLPYGFQYSKRFLLFGIKWVHQVEKIGPTAFSVPSESTDALDPFFCDCPAFRRFKVTPYPFCKHIVAAMVKEQDVTDAFFDWLIQKDKSDVGDMDEYLQARWEAGTASRSILEPLPEFPVERASVRCVDTGEGVVEQTHRTQPSTALPRLNEERPQFSGKFDTAIVRRSISRTKPVDWQVAYQTCCDVVDGIINDLVSWGKLRKDNPSHYDRNEWLLIYHFCQKEAKQEPDPKSLNQWSYNSAVFLDRCREAIAVSRRRR